MKTFASTLFALVVLGAAVAVPAGAQQVIGGHDETSEPNAGLWSVGAITPGTAGPIGASHLLLTEVVVTPTAAEFVEIHNPGTETVDLSKYYLTDAWFVPAGGSPHSYHLLPSGTLNITTNTDFCVKFPAGATIGPGGTLVIALYGPGVDSTFAAGTADYEITSVSAAIPDMVNVGNNNPAIAAGATTLTNGSELIMLFYWDGASDNVCDVDYVTWGASSGTSRVDKTGLSVDGPDGDAIATPYFNDTAIALQSAVTAPGAGFSVARSSAAEGAETPTGGNGCIAGGPTATDGSTWGRVKVRYR